MSEAPAALAIIPVRLGSQRLPGKALLADTGRPLFLHTHDRAAAARRFAAVVVATDDAQVTEAATAAGAAIEPTSTTPRTGSERCAEVAERRDEAIVVDIQGDWPEVLPADLERLVAAVEAGAACATLAAPLPDAVRDDPNVVKVVRRLDGRALYFSRAALPHSQNGGAVDRLRHVGVYAFRRDVLRRVPALPSSGLAETEGLEQLRFLENGIEIQVLDAGNEPWGIETANDYAAFVDRWQQGIAKT